MPSSKPRARRHRFAPPQRTSPGTPPGTVRAQPGATPSRVTVLTYTASGIEERHGDSSVVQPPREDCVTWVHMTGLGDVAAVQRVAEIFGLHPLAVEDVLGVAQRAKIETYDAHVFCLLRSAQLGAALELDQIAVFWGARFVLTFEAGETDALAPLRERLRRPQSRIRSAGADYLAYCVIDSVIDHFYPVIEAVSERLEELEDRVLLTPTPDVLSSINTIRADVLVLRRAIWPLREIVEAMLGDAEVYLCDRTMRPFLRDCYDHVIHLIDECETCRETGSGLMEAYRSAVSVRSGAVIKLLTIVATIFMPLNFVAAVYGMNFNTSRSPLNMPELNWYWGYAFALGVMAMTAIGMLVYFWRKGWFSAERLAATDPSGNSAGAHTG